MEDRRTILLPTRVLLSAQLDEHHIPTLSMEFSAVSLDYSVCKDSLGHTLWRSYDCIPLTSAGHWFSIPSRV
jgi:hypothetical protein